MTWNTFTNWLKLREDAGAAGTPEKAGELDKQVSSAAATATEKMTQKAPQGTNPADILAKQQPKIVKATNDLLSKQGIKAPIDTIATAIQPPKMSKKK
jgi:hypothetical protein